MKKMIITVLALALALSLAGVGWAAPPPLIEPPMTGKQQQTCPVQGGKVNKQLYRDYQGQRIYFCCPECIPIFEKNPEAYLQKLRQQGVVPEASPSGK